MSSEIKKVFALNAIVYGKAQKAPANSIFTPTSEKERNELFALEAVRELTDTEERLFEAEPAAAADDQLG